MNFLTPVDGSTWPPSVESMGDSSSILSLGRTSSCSPKNGEDSGDGIGGAKNGFPTLEITEQPQDKFRFRYKSEMMGTHGCILGQNTDRLLKTYPTVKLLNYQGHAIIRCSLVGMVSNRSDPVPHAHRLIVRVQDHDREEPQEISVDQHNNYTAVFQGMGIVHTARKHVVEELIKKKRRALLELIKGKRENDGCLTMREDLQIREDAQAEAKVMNLNIVHLCFEALYEDGRGHLMHLCEKVVSASIRNMKCAQTGELKICRIDKHVSCCLGGEDVFVLVEKVAKKNIQIRFFELDEEENEIWEDFGKFTELDVHHQYAVVFRTPRYRDVNIEQPVDVFLQLYRPSDKDTSDPIRFTYKPQPLVCRKRLRTQISEVLPTAYVQGFVHQNEIDSVQPTIVAVEGQQNSHHEKFLLSMSSAPIITDTNNAPCDLSRQDSLLDIEKLIGDYNASDNNISWGSSGYNVNDVVLDNRIFQPNAMHPVDFDCDLATDCVGLPARTSIPDQTQKALESQRKSCTLAEKNYLAKLCTTTSVKYPFSMIMKQIIDLNFDLDKEILMKILDKSNRDGNTVLHLLVEHQHCLLLERLLTLLKKYNLTHHIDSTNDLLETPLHLAILHNDMEKMRLLLQAGAKPEMKNIQGNNAFHIAVLTNQKLSDIDSSLRSKYVLELLSFQNNKASEFQLSCLNDTNEAGLTPLHLAVECGDLEVVRALLEANCSVNWFDDHGGCSALHMALVAGNIQMTELLLSHPYINVEYCNRREMSALQLVNVLKGENYEQLSELLRKKLNISEVKVEQKSDSEGDEDDEESECWPSEQCGQVCGDSQKIQVPGEICNDSKENNNSDYNEALSEDIISGISNILDLSGKWKDLACILDNEFLASAMQEQISPSRALLNYADVNGGITLKGLKNMMELIGEEDAVVELQKLLVLQKCIKYSCFP
ncbi:nuclear factor NF-kappa-B p110 subunit isoform X2 [Hetaerina americana]|uniref:nuclear factor NF-kappa-B p110 subunit isoform X2 n=1 Tax=Hetaerina americana TaxID=62018 RepID=UPI003A7F3542